MSEFGTTLRFALCALDDDNNVVAKTEPLTAEWSAEMEHDVKKELGVSIRRELGIVMLEELKRSIKPENLTDLIDKVMEK